MILKERHAALKPTPWQLSHPFARRELSGPRYPPRQLELMSSSSFGVYSSLHLEQIGAHENAGANNPLKSRRRRKGLNTKVHQTQDRLGASLCGAS